MKKNLDLYFVVLLVYIYVILSPPFIFSAYISFEARVILEIIPLLLLAMVMKSKKDHAIVFKYLFIWLIISLMIFLNTDSAFTSVTYSILKLIFLFSIMSTFYDSNFLFNLVRKFWFGMWVFISLSVITSFFAYQFMIVDFTFLDFGKVSETAPYHYYNNLFFGNIRKSIMFGYDVPRITWYIFEPGILSFFLGLNVLIANSFSTHSKHVRIFKILNICAGILTFSTTFYIYFILYFGAMIAGSGSLKRWALFVVPISTVVISLYLYSILLDPNIGKFTSFGQRIFRIEIALEFIKNNSLLTLLFGNGIGISSVVFDRGISSGVLSIIVERGLFAFSFLLFILYKYSWHDKVVLFYILFYHLAFEPVWYSAFLLALSITYIASRSAQEIYPNTDVGNRWDLVK